MAAAPASSTAGMSLGVGAMGLGGAAATAAGGGAGGVEPLKHARCLVVDANETLQCLVHSWFTSLGITHIQVFNGQMAAAACQEYRFETIFLDLDATWPAPLANALTVIQFIRSYGLNGRTPVVGWTGQAPHDMLMPAYGKLVSTVLTKPFCKEDVIIALERSARATQVVPVSFAPPSSLLDLFSLPSEIPPVPLPPKSARVLVVEDCKGTQKIIHSLLRHLTDNVMQAYDGDQAVVLCKEWHFDIIFMDIHMPTINGLLATSLIRSAGGLNIYTPIIAFTSSGLSDYASYGMNDLLTKPFTTDSLRDMFDKWTPFSKKQDSVLAAALDPPPLPLPLSHPPRPLTSLTPLFEAPPPSSLVSSSLVSSSLAAPPGPDIKTPVLLAPPSTAGSTSPREGGAGGPWPRRKKTNPIGHTVKEKQRRASIVHSCNCFRSLVPNTAEDDKASVFRKAVDYLSFLKSHLNAEELARVEKLYKESARSKAQAEPSYEGEEEDSS